jgi:5,10-methenyltetrahydrofolate synthetase
MNDHEDEQREYASPACYAHELDPLYRDLEAPDGATRRDVMRWRKAERERLRALRNALDAEQRTAALQSVCEQLDQLLNNSEVTVLGGYWPIHHELDLRAWMRRQADAGMIIALPVIHARDQPLRYSRWHPQGAMRRGPWGIAEPAEDEWLEPQMLLAPLLGVDRHNYRLGNGGGYFDRSLAAAAARPLAVGVGYHCARIATIYPQAHDIPMGVVITG